MRIQRQKYGYKKSYSIIAVLFILVVMGLGCASARKTTRTETTVAYSDGAVGNVGNGGNFYRGTPSSVVENSETTTTTSETTTTETKAENPGVLTSTFHAIGYVISLPFRIIGGLFRIIFGG